MADQDFLETRLEKSREELRELEETKRELEETKKKMGIPCANLESHRTRVLVVTLGFMIDQYKEAGIEVDSFGRHPNSRGSLGGGCQIQKCLVCGTLLLASYTGERVQVISDDQAKIVFPGHRA